MSVEAFHQRTRIRLLQAGGVALGLLLLAGQPRWTGAVHERLEFLGFCLVVACIAGRLWSILYLGGRKNRSLVVEGPYSMTRNPLYVFSTIGAVGVGLIYGSVVVALLLGVLSAWAFFLTARKEEAYLREAFGQPYATYAARTPLFWPRPSLYRDSAEVSFSPKVLKQTFLDGLVFLAMFPALEAIEWLQAEGVLKVFFHFA
ncbi:isoprenylcysteine carboxylmethyltransferase family protein [Aquibium sp. ELW1220]|uniref:methyltransferase family protein n=1 Tax=Aquibium sp. ELW1220 TaxID=2976766 RepID=UPI0025AF8C80|nr:isoprenylcysteine carboxylmethyltransferase family protein [Aquibium sp. ELW1220]MDN2583678.1 isoprenylcysteine carboxylmethyltransferase family protein [Aquibium sp. ELW1220]